jgi:hypothetical protein
VRQQQVAWFIHAINRISTSAHHSTIIERRSCQLACSRNPLIYVFASRPGLLRQHPENELLLVFVKWKRGHALCISACGAGLKTDKSTCRSEATTLTPRERASFIAIVAVLVTAIALVVMVQH